jgi:signal transduction histidine kinase
VVGERPLLKRLVSNLVQNAIKYNVEGGQVHVAVGQPGRLVFSNTGPQVGPDQVGGLFQPFRRQSGDRLDHGGGVGLGLTIARSIVAAHRGRIGAVANPGGGLTVDVTLTGWSVDAAGRVAEATHDQLGRHDPHDRVRAGSSTAVSSRAVRSSA